MHSTIVRGQNVFGFFTTVCFAVAALIAASDLLAPRTPRATVAANAVQVVKGRPHYYSTKKEEYAIIRFTMNADFSSLFTWNTKQVFVYVSASWPNSTSSELTNEAVIWDTIITNPSADHLQNIGPAAMKKGRIDLKNVKPKYQITAPSGKLQETDDVVLKVHYNVQPWVGILTWTPQIEFGKWKKLKGGMSKAFKIPAIKKKDTPKKA
ncbi:hypothetical protein G7Y89_g7638 [Cudoniella acicularis]|uniref:Signal peptidase subunit 3 n=1 Tax=Cudoniella acicularis TaxID=354080 RepID=A0A8H4RI48_9HELO|nr:hypothetical protein G7Y89_g7638 [Cudoniella acicularis]